jgi:carbon-monoxide dehydrogenase iron sulfur subunit
MTMMLMIHPDKCTGCHNCELACSLEHEGDCRPKASRIHVYTWEREGFSVPMMCQQCNDAPCITTCLPKALRRNAATGQVDLVAAKCIGCKMCVQACPFGNASWDFLTSAILKCDTCSGDPACVRICPSGALAWVADTVSAQVRKRAFATKLKNAFLGA